MVKTVPSLHPGSQTRYVGIQLRCVSEDSIRIQATCAKGLETAARVSNDLRAYINGLAHTNPSMAGTGAMYVKAQAMIHNEKVEGYARPVRIQIAGPKLNRDWGTEFVVNCSSLYSFITTVFGVVPSTPPSTPPSVEDDLDEEDEEDEDEEEEEEEEEDDENED